MSLDENSLDSFAEEKADQMIMVLNSLPDGTPPSLILGTIKGQILKLLREFEAGT